MQYCFMGKYFVVRLSTMKTTKILPPKKYLLYGIHTAIKKEDSDSTQINQELQLPKP